MTQPTETTQKDSEFEETQSTHESLLQTHPQLNWMSRHFPKAPGFFPVPVDIVITNIMQEILIFTNILVLFSSAVIDHDNKDELGWIVFIMFLFTWIGFGVYIWHIRHHAIIYRTFFKCIDKCYYKENARLENNKDAKCWCFRWISIRLFWWSYALIIFPIIILWSVYKSFQHYKNQRKIRNDAVTTDITQIDWDSNHTLDINDQDQYIKIAETTYGISHLGVLSKQASMVVLFVQDLPLLILTAIIGNELGLIVYPIIIVLKLVFWVKYLIDVGGFRVFYKYEDYADHFGLRSVEWKVDTFGCSYAVPIYVTDGEKQKLLWRVRDYVKCLKNQESKKDKITVGDPSFGDRNFESTEEMSKMIADKGVYTYERWDGGIQPLSNDELIEFLQTKDESDNNSDEATEVKAVTTQDTHVKHASMVQKTEVLVYTYKGNEKEESSVGLQI